MLRSIDKHCEESVECVLKEEKEARGGKQLQKRRF